MNKRIKRLWIKALRSKKYTQGTGQLKRGRIEPEHCCLGVLCELAKAEGVISSYRGTDGYLPLKVGEWAGLAALNPRIGKRTATSLNDTGKSFTEIAERIEKHL
jgi:hypothetical protein